MIRQAGQPHIQINNISVDLCGRCVNKPLRLLILETSGFIRKRTT